MKENAMAVIHYGMGMEHHHLSPEDQRILNTTGRLTRTQIRRDGPGWRLGASSADRRRYVSALLARSVPRGARPRTTTIADRRRYVSALLARSVPRGARPRTTTIAERKARLKVPEAEVAAAAARVLAVRSWWRLYGS